MMDSPRTRVLVERRKSTGVKSWSRAWLVLDEATGTIELRFSRRLRKPDPPLIFQASRLESFEVVPVDDPHAKLYVAPVVLSILALLGPALDDTLWEPIVDVGVLLLDGALALLLVQWLKRPAIRLAQPAPVAEGQPVPLAIPPDSDPKTSLKSPQVRKLINQHVGRLIQEGRYGDLRALLGRVARDPAVAQAEADQPGEQWVHITATLRQGSGATRALGRRMADVLAAHRYRGLMPDLAGQDLWRQTRIRSSVAAALALLVLVTTVAIWVRPLLPLADSWFGF